MQCLAPTGTWNKRKQLHAGIRPTLSSAEGNADEMANLYNHLPPVAIKKTSRKSGQPNSIHAGIFQLTHININVSKDSGTDLKVRLSPLSPSEQFLSGVTKCDPYKHHCKSFCIAVFKEPNRKVTMHKTKKRRI